MGENALTEKKNQNYFIASFHNINIFYKAFKNSLTGCQKTISFLSECLVKFQVKILENKS